MSTKIERLLYYERQYLRSFDFTAEQNYHLEMRRRLNLALHLWGIVEGLDIKTVEAVAPEPGTSRPDPTKEQNVSGVPAQFSISPGMAIDAYGREIFLFAPYVLSEDDVLRNRINAAGKYSLYIAYDHERATPPASGFRVCDIKDQYTRWRESYRIIISNDSNPATEPKVTGEIPDDPDKYPWLVKLGWVTIDSALNIDGAQADDRTYIRSRAQRIIAPSATTARDANLPIVVEADLNAEKNLIVGKYFEIDSSKVKPPPPAAPPFPGAEGNLRIANNVFVQGKLYAKSGLDWIELQQYILKLIPEIQISSKTIVPVANGNPSQGTETISLTSSLDSIKSAKMIAAISSINWLSKANYGTWEGNIAGGPSAGSPIQLEVIVGTPPNFNNPVAFPVTWKVGPQATTPLNKLHITSITISYIAIFTP